MCWRLAAVQHWSRGTSVHLATQHTHGRALISGVYPGAYMGLSAPGIMQLFLVSHMSGQCHSHSGCQHLSFCHSKGAASTVLELGKLSASILEINMAPGGLSWISH